MEGNISAGKSSFLQRILKGSVELRDIVEVQTPLPLLSCAYAVYAHDGECKLTAGVALLATALAK